jgi:histidine triad (HIT) family protein
MSEVGVDAPTTVPTETIFTKIMDKKIPAEFVYEDDTCIAIKDINPTAPVHLLVIPRKIITQTSKATEEDKATLGHCIYVAGQIGKDHCPNGFRLVINDGKEARKSISLQNASNFNSNSFVSVQSVYHLHIHVIGGRELVWPPA